MKKIVLFALAAVIVIGCAESKAKNNGDKYVYDDREVSREITRYGCEYWIYRNEHGGFPVHKGNCKYCTERRKKEIEEMINQLKSE